VYLGDCKSISGQLTVDMAQILNAIDDINISLTTNFGDF
jgi:hypothetical protein